MVLGGSVNSNARIEDYAVVTGGTVSGSAIVRGHATVQGGAVSGSAIVDDYATIVGGTISQFARVEGDARVEAGQIRGNALLLDYAWIFNNSTVVAGETVIKGYGVVDNAQMNGNALVASSGLAAGTGLVTDRGVQFNGEPSAEETPLMSVQYDNLFAQYDFATPDDNAVWDSFNTTYGWVSNAAPQWILSESTAGNDLGGILQFGSDDQFIELSPELAHWRDYTIALWARWDGEGEANQRILEFGSDPDNYMALQPTSDEGGVKFVIAVDGAEHELRGIAPLAAGTWQHVAVTFSGDTAVLYVNGSAVSTRTNVTVDPHQLRSSYALLGRGLTGGGFRGAMDSLRIYSDARTANEILSDVREVYPGFNLPPSGDFDLNSRVDGFDFLSWQRGESNIPLSSQGLSDWQENYGAIAEPYNGDVLVAHYAFDGNTSDSSGLNDATATGGPTYVGGANGLAINLDGVDDYVTLPASVANHEDISIAAWVYWDGGGVWQRIFDFGNNTTQYMFLTPRSGGNTLRFAITNSGNGAEQMLETSQLPTGQWVHVAVTLGGSVGRLYVNGIQAAAGIITLNPTDFEPLLNYVGKSQWPDPLFDGRIDDFRIYNFELSSTEIASLASLTALSGHRTSAASEEPAIANATAVELPSSLALTDAALASLASQLHPSMVIDIEAELLPESRLLPFSDAIVDQLARQDSPRQKQTIASILRSEDEAKRTEEWERALAESLGPAEKIGSDGRVGHRTGHLLPRN
ncbi:MAG: hypothetical protein CMJ58_18620 [Planctomycetaceae bacterium]|nr:hypothetical protein [Planctomycetaceae bacterium]